MVFYYSASENTSNSTVFGGVAKLCRESRPFLAQFYVANHAVLVTHFNPQKSGVWHKTTFYEVWLPQTCTCSCTILRQVFLDPVVMSTDRNPVWEISHFFPIFYSRCAPLATTEGTNKCPFLTLLILVHQRPARITFARFLSLTIDLIWGINEAWIIMVCYVHI